MNLQSLISPILVEMKMKKKIVIFHICALPQLYVKVRPPWNNVLDPRLSFYRVQACECMGTKIPPSQKSRYLGTCILLFLIIELKKYLDLQALSILDRLGKICYFSKNVCDRLGLPSNQSFFFQFTWLATSKRRWM